MRTSLFLSTLFVVSMTAGAALAEKPHDASQSREPRAMEHLRAHGDTVDKVYHAADQTRGAQQQAQSADRSRQAQQGKNPFDRSASRINCSDGGSECTGSHAVAPNTQGAMGAEATSAQTGRAAHMPAFLDKIAGSDRTDINEAGLEEGMSNRAVKRAWSSHRAAGNGGSASSAAAMSAQKMVDRHDKQYQSSRSSCNEADECSQPTKEVKKEWSYAAVKAGTWQGPDKPAASNAERRIKEQNARLNGQTLPTGAADPQAKPQGGSQDQAH